MGILIYDQVYTTSFHQKKGSVQYNSGETLSRARFGNLWKKKMVHETVLIH